MSINESTYSKPVYKYFRGKWKELGIDEENTTKTEETEYHVKDLEEKSVIELEELIMRQQKILKNKVFISKLQDKGNKLMKKYEDLQNALKIVKEKTEKSDEKENTSNLPKDINLIEWHGDVKGENNIGNLKNGIIEDDDESNPLLLLARHSVEYPETTHDRDFKFDEENSSELIAKELERLHIEDKSTATATASEKDEKSSSNYFGKKLLDFENDKRKFNRKPPFKTNRLKSNKNSETTTTMIPIAESLKLMAETHNKDRERSYTETAAALQQSPPMGMSLPSSLNLNYRDANTSQHFLEEYEDDMNDYVISGLSEEEEEDASEY